MDSPAGSDGVQPRVPLPVYLVELPAGGSGPEDASRMQEALRHAVSRRAASGAAIRWAGGLLVPSDGRCLCLVEAATEDDVRLARDLAGLHAASVRLAHVLSGPAAPPPIAHGAAPARAPRKESP